VLEEGPLGDAPLELLGRQEVVLDAVALAGPPPSRRRGDGDLEIRKAGKDALDERALPRTRWSRDDDDAGARRYR
jgi:hypothetical protein